MSDMLTDVRSVSRRYQENMIKLIAAVAADGVIGRGGCIPWDLPEDRRIFKELTMGCVLIMGRVTYESIGRPLPGRETIVVTSSDMTGKISSEGSLTSKDHQSEQSASGVRTARSMEDAIQMAGDKDVYICGGERIYAEGLKLADILYITKVELAVEGDRYFPRDYGKGYRLTYRERLSANCTLMIYVKETLI